MSDTKADDRGEPDPLLQFFVEPETRRVAAKPANRVEPAEPVEPVEPAEPVEPVEPVEPRLLKTEAEIAALRAELATLVSTVDDIKKRMNRRPEARPVIARPPAVARPRAVASTIAIVIFGIAIGILGLRFITESSAGVTELPPAPIESPVERESPPVAAAAIVPQPQLVAAEVPPAAPLLAPPRDPPVRNQQAVRNQPAVRNQAVPEAPRRIDYVGTLSIDAEPAGQVFLNRKPVGSTPMRLDNLRAGSHLIWIERDGYRRWTRVVQVPADRVSRVSASLEPLPR